MKKSITLPGAGILLLLGTQPCISQSDYEISSGESPSISLAVSEGSWAQTEISPVQNFHSTLLGYNIQNSVQYNTGTLNVYIPLSEMAAGDISLPVGLSYSARGIKVQDISSPVGIGWDLSGPCKITRIIRGGPDEEATYGYINSCWLWNKEWDNKDFENFYSKPPKNSVPYDMEPDLFHFEIAGKSGYFFFDTNRNAHLMPHQDITIEWKTVDGNYDTMVIRDDSGNTYTFGGSKATETTTVTRSDSDQEQTYISKWYLKTIEALNGDQITFSYNINRYSRQYYLFSKERWNTEKCGGKCQHRPNREEVLKYHNDRQSSDFNDHTTTITQTIDDHELAKIIWKGGSVIFSFIPIHDDYNIRKLTDIYVNQEGAIYRYKLNHNTTTLNKRLCFESLDLTINNHTERIAQFDYCTSPKLPDRDSRIEFTDYGFTNSVNGIMAGVLTRIKKDNGSITEFEYDNTGNSLRIIKKRKRMENHIPIQLNTNTKKII